MDRKQTAVVAAAGAAAAAAGWGLLRRADARALAADPERSLLDGPPEGRPLDVRGRDGNRLNVEVFGPEGAPTIVLVHCWTGAIRLWTWQIRALAGDFRVVAYDHRGHGRSEAPANEDYSIEALSDDFDAVLDAALPEGERALAAGHSLGAMTIVGWAGRHPDEVERKLAAAALLNTGMGDFISQSLVVRAPAGIEGLDERLGELILASRLPLPKQGAPLTARLVRSLVLSPDASPAAVALTQQTALDCPPGARAGCGGTLAKLDLYRSIERLTVPTVVIAGKGDRLTPLPHSERLAETLPNLVALEEFETGHMGPLEAREGVSARLRELALRELGPVAA